MPSTSANSGVELKVPNEKPSWNSRPTTTASVNCCQRRGGRVSGSSSMKQAKNTIGDESRARPMPVPIGTPVIA